MTQLTTVVDGYIAMWNETDPERRRSIIEQTWTEDGSYVDPHAEVAGADGLDALVAAVQQQFPGYRFVLASGPETHHDRRASPGSSWARAAQPSPPAWTSPSSPTTAACGPSPASSRPRRRWGSCRAGATTGRAASAGGRGWVSSHSLAPAGAT